MVELYGYSFLLCLGVAVGRLDNWNHNTETHKIAYKDAKACFVLALVILVNWGIFYFLKEKNHFSLFISGMTALSLSFWRKDLCAELLSGLLSILALVYTVFPPV